MAYGLSHDLPREGDAAVVVGVRPEDIEVVASETSGSTLTTRVERREALGSEILVHLSIVDASEVTSVAFDQDDPLGKECFGQPRQADVVQPLSDRLLLDEAVPVLDDSLERHGGDTDRTLAAAVRSAAAAPAVGGARSADFSNAPGGQICGDISAKMKIPPIGLYDTQIQQALTTQLTSV